MTPKRSTAQKPAIRDLVITRIFDAPRVLVWKVWTDPEHLKQWWGPKIFTAPSITNDFRVGGKYLYAMQSPQWNEGRAIWSTGVYREIVPLKRIVATDSFADEKGNVVPATHYGMGGNIPMEMLVTVTFEEHEGRTKLTLRHAGLPSDIAGGADQGWNESLDKLAEVLKAAERKLALVILSDTEIVMTRVFDAPRKLVWEAYTDPKHIPHWWGPREDTTVVDKMDVRPGGVWRFIIRDSNGNELAFSGVYREVTPPSRLVSTFEVEGRHVSVDTLTLVEHRGKTRMTVHGPFQSREDRDGMIDSGMEAGFAETLDRLAELLETLKKGKQYARKK